ncbi:hypothetical protein [Hymenobacter edaphi]|uniref:hypothetical protein n=1 Tax=Hymenobacter edaphi TaxID=2211146 RepID=UPI0014035026|nr:hypothetical protein [Hymenobacter edaphi]
MWFSFALPKFGGRYYDYLFHSHMVFRKRLGALLVLVSSCGGEQAPSISEQAPPPGPVAAENPQEAARRKSSVRHFLRWYQGR